MSGKGLRSDEVNEFPCPDCSDGVGDRVKRERTPDGLKTLFECSNCDYTWEVVF